MRVTTNLKNQIKKAMKSGYTHIYVTRSRNYNTNASIDISFKKVLKFKNGEYYPIPFHGQWETKENLKARKNNISIKYSDLMKLK